jgi:hypothetical protein
MSLKELAMPMLEPLSPWADEPEGDTLLDRQLSHVFGAVPEPSALPEFSRQRLAVRLRKHRRRGAGLMLVRLVAVGAVIGVGSAAAAQWAATHWFSAQQQLVTPRARPIVSDPPLVPQPSLPRAPKAEPAAEPAASEPEPRPSSAAFPPPASSQRSPLGREAASLEGALTALRGGGTARATQALRQLEQHLREFPHGTLELEARIARVDALLVLGRRNDARHELSTLPIESVGRKHELRLIRAELRADQDCSAALSDFQVLIEQASPAAFAERALFGRGACLLRLGDSAGAERDFARYLERFPNGRFAAQIRAQR